MPLARILADKIGRKEDRWTLTCFSNSQLTAVMLRPTVSGLVRGKPRILERWPVVSYSLKIDVMIDLLQEIMQDKKCTSVENDQN